ncbi:MlaD family protein [Aquimarina addita]|uniref:MlaD family protein n=1 Tax=Aquimarina addita TaxID=870485 RepID=A0ABP6UKA2_9FLAO
MKFTREVKTGILALVAIALLIFGYSFLKGNNLLKNDRTFYALYDNVEGLIPSSPVTINGLVVGKVISIDFADTRGKLVVEFNVDNDFSFSRNSEAKVYGGGLIGGKSLAIIPVYEQGMEAKDRDTLPGRVEAGLLELVNEKLTPLQAKLETAISDADTLLTSVNTVLSIDNQNNLNAIFKDLSVTVKNFKGVSGSLNNLLSGNQNKLDRTFTNLDEMSTELKQFTGNLSKVDVDKLASNVETVLNNIDKTVGNLDNGTLGKLMKDEKLYNNLEKSTRQLELLLQDLRLNPKRYVHISVFGKNNQPYESHTDSIN